jgi:hypothetical protein
MIMKSGVRHHLSICAALAAALLAAAPARSAERAADAVPVVQVGAPQGPAAASLPSVSPTAGVGAPRALASVSAPLSAPAQAGPAAGATLAAPAALAGGQVNGAASAAPSGSRVFGAAPQQARPVFGKKGAAPVASPTPALPASAVASAASPRGPPSASHASEAQLGGADHPLIQRAKEEARKLGVSAQTDGAPDAAAERETALQLQLLRTRGWGVLPAGSVVTPQRAANIAAEVDRDWQRGGTVFNNWELYDEFKGWRKDVGADAQGRGGTRELLEDLTRRVQAALPGEDIELRDAMLRLRYQKMDSDFLHVDGGGYITATIALKGPGTQIYDFADGVQEHVAPLNAVALITNVDRERAMNIDGTLHSSPSPARYTPARDNDERRVIIARFKRKGQPKATDAERERFERRQKIKQSLAQGWRDKKSGRPQKKGFSLFGITVGGGGE